MVILVDTREQDTERARRRYEAFGAPYRRCVLDAGDYSYDAEIAPGKWLCESESRIRPRVAIERKMNLDELAVCFTHERNRFEREMQRARSYDCKLFLIIENATWENLLGGRYRSRFNPKAFLASVMAWTLRYDLRLIFCKEESTGRLIREICYRDLKERLEKSEI